MFLQQVDQWSEYIIQSDNLIRHRRAAEVAAIARQDLFQAVQRQCIGILGDQDIGQQ
jgi:hypothetical protein